MYSYTQKKDKDRRKGIGCRYCLLATYCCSAILHQDDSKNRMNSSYYSYRPGAIHPILQIVLVQNGYLSKELNQFCPPSIAAASFAFSSVFIHVLCTVTLGEVIYTLIIYNLYCIEDHEKIDFNRVYF